jgi:SAM-dependent methyltransferase
MPFMSSLTHRRLQPELMDDPDVDPGAHRAALRGLARLNRASLIERTVARELRDIAGSGPVRVLDIAAGSGDLVVGLALFAKRRRLPWEFSACDISPTACETIVDRAKAAGVNVAVDRADVLSDPIPGKPDIAMCHLFLHHLDEAEISRLLAAMREAANRAVLITDLRRTRLGFALAWLASRTLTRSPIVHTDALRSVEGALTIPELESCAKEARMNAVRIRGAWPERMILRCEV